MGVAKSALVRRALCGIIAGAMLLASPAASRAKQDQQQGQVVTLPELERFVDNAPELSLAMSAARYSSAKIASLRSRNGPQFTFSPSGGAYRELVTDTLIRNFVGADLSFGIRVPLFGGYAEHGAFAELGDELTARRFDVDEARLTVLRELRKRYVDYWISARRLAVTKAYLKSELEVGSAIALRVQSGLSLRGDGLQAMAGYDLARENAAHFARDASAALTEMRRLTGRALGDFRPVEPDLNAGCQTQEEFVNATLAASPGLALLRQQLDESRHLAGAPIFPLQGAMTVSQGLVVEQGAEGAGRSTTIGFDLSLPFDSAGAISSQREVYAARADDIAARLRYETEHLRAEANDAWNSVEEATLDVQVAQRSIVTARELAREGLLRYGSLTGDTVEKLQGRRLAYYQSLLSGLDSEALLAQRRIITTSPSGGCAIGRRAQREALRATSAPPAGSDHELRVYVWNSGDLLGDDWTRSTYWDRFRGLGIRRLMLSLDASQLAAAQSPNGRGRLQRFIAAARSSSVDVDLLLGEPHWLLPDQRSHLISIVQELADVPFHTLELDIEPAQLSAETRLSTGALQSDMVETIRMVASVSKWPLSLSANYRDFLSTTSSDRNCYACALALSGVKEIVLLTYVANPERVAQLVRPILQSHPAVSFAVAQSVEPTLPVENSYRANSRPQFLNSMSRLTDLLDGEQNFSGIVVQSYRDYAVMRP